MVEKIFDFHTHSHDPVAFMKVFNLQDDTFPRPHDYIPHHADTLDANLRQTIAHFDTYNIVQALLNGPHTDAWIQQYPERFLKATRINLQDNIEEQVVQFETEVRKGLTHCLGEIGLAYAGMPLNSEVLYPFYEVCVTWGVPILLHTGLNGPQVSNILPNWRISNNDPILFESVLSSFPTLKTVFAHFGYPYLMNTIYMLATYNSTYADISVFNWFSKSMLHRVLLETVETVGSKKLLFGTDQMIWPQNIALAVENTLSAPLEKQDLENIMYNSAVTLLGV